MIEPLSSNTLSLAEAAVSPIFAIDAQKHSAL
jgi:hypothetical protein